MNQAFRGTETSGVGRHALALLYTLKNHSRRGLRLPLELFRFKAAYSRLRAFPVQTFQDSTMTRRRRWKPRVAALGAGQAVRFGLRASPLFHRLKRQASLAQSTRSASGRIAFDVTGMIRIGEVLTNVLHHSQACLHVCRRCLSFRSWKPMALLQVRETVCMYGFANAKSQGHRVHEAWR